MDTLKCIETRRSVGKVTQKPVPKDVLEKIIQAGCWAPNHYNTEPWRFVVLEGEGRQKLADAFKQATSRIYEGDETLEFRLGKVKAKPFRAPAIIMLWCAAGRSDKKNPPAWEDVAAVSACAQNMSLACHALGYGSIWRTGAMTKAPEVQKLCVSGEDVFDAEKGDAIVGFLYVGDVDGEHHTPHRDTPEFADKCLWVNG